MRRWNWVIVGLVAIMAITTALMVQRSTAQEDDWSAIFYDVSEDLWWVRARDGSGRLNSLSISGSGLASNHAGSHLAYCSTDDSGQVTFHLVETAELTEVLTSDLGTGVRCQIERNAFTPDGTRVWVGLAGDPTADQPAWQLLEVGVSDGAIISSLDSNSLFASIVDATGGPMMPHVLAADDVQVVFGVADEGVVGSPDMQAYRWKTNDLATLPGWGESGAEGLLATKEAIWPEIDPNLPALAPPDSLPAYNTVRYVDNSGISMPIYQATEWIIRDVAWINQGQQVAIVLVSPEDVAPSQIQRVLVNRDGSVIEEPPAELLSVAFMDSRDGYVLYTVRSRSSGEIHATLQRYIGTEGKIVAAFDQATAPLLWWVTPSTPLTDLPPFAPLGAASTPTNESSATPTAGLSPTLGATSTPSHIAVTANFTPTPTSQQATPPAATNTRIAATPSATSGIHPPSSRTNTPSSGGNPSPTNTQIRPPATATSRPATNTPRPSSTFTPAATNTRPPANTSAPGVAPTSTPRRGQLGSPTPNTGPTSRPASSTPRASNTPAPTNTRTPTFTPSRTPTFTLTRTPTMTRTPTRDVVPSKTPLPTTSGLPSKTPISGPTSTLSGGGNVTRLRITNNAGTELCEIYFTPNTESTWGENYLEDGDVLANGASLEWVVDPAVYDVKVFDCFANSLEEFGFDLTTGSLEVQISSSAMTGVPIR